MSNEEERRPIKRIRFDFDTEVKSKKYRKSNTDDRKDFIDWMFDHIEDVKGKSKNETAKWLSKTYSDENECIINYNWVYMLLRLGIVKYDDDTYGFKKTEDYTVDDLCEHPGVIRNIHLETM